MRKIACPPDDDRRELFQNTANKMGLNDAFSHIDLLKTVVDFKMKFSLFGKVFLLYINSFLFIFP